MPEHREALLVMHRFKFPVASADGTRQEIREFHPGEFLPRADWDRAPARSRRSMSNTGFVRDPLSVQINTRTGTPEPLPTPGRAKVVLRAPRTITQVDRKTGELVTIQDPGGIDRKLQQSQTSGDGGTRINTTATETTGQPVKRKRGRPRKVKE